jgi:hypothetical protein
MFDFSHFSGKSMKITFPIYKRQKKKSKKMKIKFNVKIEQKVVFIVSSTHADIGVSVIHTQPRLIPVILFIQLIFL